MFDLGSGELNCSHSPSNVGKSVRSWRRVVCVRGREEWGVNSVGLEEKERKCRLEI